jgi:hypothetical protein
MGWFDAMDKYTKERIKEDRIKEILARKEKSRGPLGTQSVYGLGPEYWANMSEENRRKFFNPDMLEFMDPNEYFQIMPEDHPKRKNWDNMSRRGGPLASQPKWTEDKFAPKSSWLSWAERSSDAPAIEVHEGPNVNRGVKRNPVHPDLPWYRIKVDF